MKARMLTEFFMLLKATTHDLERSGFTTEITEHSEALDDKLHAGQHTVGYGNIISP